MPLIGNDDAQVTGASGFGFSPVNFNNLGASEYTLVGLACDESSSVFKFAREIEGCVKNSLQGCVDSPRADNLLVRTLAFNHNVRQVHGFRELLNCPLSEYDNFLKPGGTTSLYDASIDLIDSLAAQGKILQQNKYMANAISVIITDGEDVGSAFKVDKVAEAVERAMQTESLESIVTILIGVNVTDPRLSQYLKDFRAAAKIREYIEAPDATPKTFAKVTGFITASVSSQSQAIRTGKASQPITW